MNSKPTFALVPIGSLRAHEEIVERKVRKLAEELVARGVFYDPIWVARDSGVILNGHHRTAALRRLGARRVPAWLVDYDAESVHLGRWRDGPPISKAEVVDRARTGRLFPPQTTRHTITDSLPARPTRLAELGVDGPRPAAKSHARRAGSGRAMGAGSSPPG
jgi:L-serine kinase (ADP)